MNRARIEFEELALRCRHADFPARYMAACNLRALVRAAPSDVRPETVVHLEAVLLDRRLVQHRQALFLFREVAQTLAAILTGPVTALSGQARTVLKRLMRGAKGPPHRAVTETLGGLPFVPCGPPTLPEEADRVVRLSWRDFVSTAGVMPVGAGSWIGRSLVLPLVDRPEILVIKFARQADRPRDLLRECVFLQRLGQESYPERFDVPLPLRFGGGFLVSLPDAAGAGPAGLDPAGRAIAFLAHPEYFFYPNDPENRLDRDDFAGVMVRSAFLFGRLSGRGIVHSAPIPLFHNRIQRRRREDKGVYDWPLGGRLDQWLASCRHPNFGLTGIRDFEHFLPLGEDGRGLYWHLGAQLLSLLLVAASYFRFQAGEKDQGGKGEVIDRRDVFEARFLAVLVGKIFKGYYHGFTGGIYQETVPFDLDRLVARMIEEMGMDRHMDEILRRADQQVMTDREFQDFLERRGFSAREIQRQERGAADMVIRSGPHLGGFNERISIPELIEAVGAMAATCVVGRYLRDRKQAAA